MAAPDQIHACESIYTWPDGSRYVFNADERLDPEVFGLATQAWRFLDESLNGLRLKNDDEAWASRILMIYFAARIHGASAAATFAVAQRLGREAIILARSQYEYFVKMLYYDHNHDEANEVVRLLKSYGLRFAESVGLNVRSGLSDDAIAKIEELSKNAYRGNFTGSTDSLRNDPRFASEAAGGNPFAVGFLKNADAMFKTHWTYGSSIVHASFQDLPYVIVRETGALLINTDSRMKAPNKTVLDLNQRCFSATGLLRWRFGLGFDSTHTAWAERLGSAGERHQDEPVDIRGMHD